MLGRIAPTFFVGWLLIASALVVGRLEGPRWLAASLAIAAATIFIARLSNRLAFRLLQVKSPAFPLQPPTKLQRFDPLVSFEVPSGYVGYTESFSAEGRLLAMLEELEDEPARICTVGFCGAYLAGRLGQEWEGPGRTSGAGSTVVPVAEMFRWLAHLHSTYPDNAPSHSLIVLGALRKRAEGYLAGRSTALGKAEREFSISLRVGGRLDWADFDRRMTEHRSLSDLDPIRTRAMLAAAGAVGASLALEHEAPTPR